MSPKSTVLLASLAGAALVVAHGHVSHIIANGVYYQNYDPGSFPYQSSPPKVVGWTANNLDNGFIEPNSFGGPDIICHKGATPGGGHATVAAGDKISIVWTPVWPESHVGPVIDYLAACNGNCETVDKTALQFFKIDAVGYDTAKSKWGSELLTDNSNSWLVQIPATLKPGNYVLRHEIIALHGGNQVNGAQAYPQCFNLQVTGSGTNVPSGTPGTALYGATASGILFNPYTSPIIYPIPGPTLIAGASNVALSLSSITATSSATVPGSGSGVVTTSSAVVVTPTTSSTSVKSTTLSTSTTAPAMTATTTPTPAPTSVQTKYGQCGGSGWTGATACVAGSSCSTVNAWYYQCV
ncbi:glycosyl hydrolase family 61-domain-containing protein [Lasiosphaeria miniovina]|uniref:lytic cellulose monooxygenase (C4-dehydrogenating) n=1 Tax=Lasiosphaeria miniovina TaxID=1954250 RepID=A0AA40B521_9PEZI|nr:glycosyl hydrolase family 61-domain-containing protein [Lasiosphaeria miniovina]KAK0727841.1 glycosyl hydrolase family 61-domain-containing protein [Lasiosphaeria miniovina]